MTEAEIEYQRLLRAYPPRPIRNDADHKLALETLEELMGATLMPQPKAELIEVHSILIETYEAKAHADNL